ncbi:DNA glycosylase, partial [Sodiomyces alkalinus F11]
MMSSQTKDTVNAVAMSRLHNELPPHAAGAPPGLTLENVLAVEPSKLNELIRVVGFHNNKTKYIKQAAEIIRDKHGSDIPTTIEGLTSLPGVGPKMAHLCLSAAWDRTEGIGVDVHVHRLTNLWGWHPRPTTSPEASRLALESWLPRDRWREINTLLVGLGQTICPPQTGGRRCGECGLGLRGLCRAADRKKVAEGRKAKVEETAIKLETYEDGVVTETVLQEAIVKEEVKKEDEEKDRI